MDVVVIGGGPGGYAAAIRCAQDGASVTLVEERDLGGTCLNRGCIPTKALLESARVFREAARMAEFGVRAEKVRLDFAAVAQRRDRVVAGLVSGLGQLLRTGGVRVVHGRGRLASPRAVDVVGPDAGRLEASAVVLAPGSEPAPLPVPGADLPGPPTSCWPCGRCRAPSASWAAAWWAASSLGARVARWDSGP